MKEHKFGILTIVFVIATLGLAIVFGKEAPNKLRLGNEHKDDGRSHITQAEAPEYGGEEPPTSGAHGDPVPAQAYTTELPDYNTIHNLEHGYIYVTYMPDLPQDQINKLQSLFFKPFSNEEFSPTKVIMAPRASNTAPIVLSSWRRSLSFEVFDEQQMIDYYQGNVNKSPEPAAT